MYWKTPYLLLVEDIGKNKLRGKFEAIRLYDISNYFLVINWCNIEDLAVSKKTDTKWNSSTFCGTVPHFMEQFHNLWNNVPKMWKSSPKSGTGPVSGSQFNKLWNRRPK